MVSNTSPTKAQLPLILMDNLCILVFRLSGFDLTLYIFCLVYSHIKSYFPEGSSANSISLIEVKLNLGNKVFKAQMKELSQQLSQCVFFKYFIIIYYFYIYLYNPRRRVLDSTTKYMLTPISGCKYIKFIQNNFLT